MAKTWNILYYKIAHFTESIFWKPPYELLQKVLFMQESIARFCVWFGSYIYCNASCDGDFLWCIFKTILHVSLHILDVNYICFYLLLMQLSNINFHGYISVSRCMKYWNLPECSVSAKEKYTLYRNGIPIRVSQRTSLVLIRYSSSYFYNYSYDN